jgi:hypothetical protein
MHIFLGVVAQIERHLVLRIGFSASNEEKPCYSVWKSQTFHVQQLKSFSAFPYFCFCA